MTGPYVPERGDLVWIQFNPQAGHEQAGRRPALVLSPVGYNRRTGLALFCPITSHAKGYPFEVALPDGLHVHGVVLSDQIKNLDWRTRQAAFMEHAPDLVVMSVLQKLKTLLNPA